jgi:cyclopropane-fatty-acyl-phospholipid synthase
VDPSSARASLTHGWSIDVPAAPSRIERFLQRRIKTGNLRARIGDGAWRAFGDGSGPRIAVSVDPSAVLRLLRRPSSLTLGECYMGGSLRLEEGEVFDLVDLIGRNSRFRPKRESWARRWVRNIAQRNDERASRGNAHHHYDLSVELYRRFLDDDLQYSCAWFGSPGTTLEAAQGAKRERIARKLLLRPGDRVLDIGCGWGGLALDLAMREDISVLGVTLAGEQQVVAAKRAAEAGLADRVRFRVLDYRKVEGAFQRIVSVGMFEHVGRENYDAYFQKIAALLAKDGVALVHSIGRRHGAGVTNPFLARYIFPGGYIPLLSEVLPAVERAGLQVADIEIWRLHYAETLKCWRERFRAHRAEVAALYDERFCRMWEYYLAISEVAFRWAGYAVFQLQLAKAADSVPVTRAYVEG